VIAALSVVVPNHTFNHLAGAGLLRPFWHWPGQVQVTRERLNARHAPQMMPSRAAAALVPFYDYADRCLADTHRLLIVGLIPEAAVFARRAYAGGQVAVFGGYYEDERYQRSIVTRLEREVVPFVLIQGGPDHNDFDATFPTVAKHVRARYLPFATFGDAGSSSGVHVMRDASVPVTGQDAATGWPCVK
jgi:hypothetical protein